MTKDERGGIRSKDIDTPRFVLKRKGAGRILLMKGSVFCCELASSSLDLLTRLEVFSSRRKRQDVDSKQESHGCLYFDSTDLLCTTSILCGSCCRLR
jgi:hypothetical protein